MSFVVYALPRSRTFWLSRFLTYGGWACGHDELRHLRSLDDVRSWFSQPLTGTVETAAAPWWRLMPSGVRVVTVRRPVDECVDSMCRLGFDGERLRCGFQRLDAKLDQIEARVPGVMSVRFADLSDEETCARVFERCLGLPHSPEWWALTAPMNLQCDLPAMFRYYGAHKPQLDKLASQAKWKIKASFARKVVADPDDVVIAREPFETFYRDAKALFAAHLVAVDEAADAFTEKNIDLMRALDRVGCLQVVTARCNGRMFGYLMTVLAPSLESRDITTAVHTTFYADPSFPGLGMKIQRVARDLLSGENAVDLFFRAGVRGNGPKMGALYRRLGARPDGELYKLELRGAV